MDRLKHMNDALSYLENHLDGEISIEKAARIAQCSQYHFQRMFSYIVGTPLSEYVRRRRLTKAAFDLQKGDKVIDVALKYGYESPTAFNRAFQAMHGTSPSEARKSDIILKAFPPVSLQIMVKGVAEIDYRIVEKPKFRAMGIRKEVGVSCEDFFVVKFSPDEENSILALVGDGSHALLGLFVGNDSDSGYYYLCFETDGVLPDGMFEVNVPKHTWAVFSGVHELEHIERLFQRIYAEWLPTADYALVDNMEMEVYTKIDANHTKYEIWLPVIKHR